LRNARQATQPGQKVRVRAERRDAVVVVEVEDEGCGIPLENQHRVFEPFFTTRGVGNGIGLGLTAAYGIIKRHGGTVEIRSEVGRGTTFSLRLPSAESAQASPALQGAGLAT